MHRPSSQDSGYKHTLFFGNRLNWTTENWKFGGEFHIRLKDNLQALNLWYLEAGASYLHTKNWEFNANFRVSTYPTKMEYRPGIGVLFKHYPSEKIQIVHQLYYQDDISNGDFYNHGLRYAIFFNYKVNNHLIPNFIAGIFQRWSAQLTGTEFIRAGGGLTYLFDQKHALNGSYFVAFANMGDGQWTTSGIIFLQLIIFFNRNFKYLPAKYIDF